MPKVKKAKLAGDMDRKSSVKVIKENVVIEHLEADIPGVGIVLCRLNHGVVERASHMTYLGMTKENLLVMQVDAPVLLGVDEEVIPEPGVLQDVPILWKSLHGLDGIRIWMPGYEKRLTYPIEQKKQLEIMK